MTTEEVIRLIKEEGYIKIWEGYGSWYAGLFLEDGAETIASGNSSRQVSFAAMRVLEEHKVEPSSIKWKY